MYNKRLVARMQQNSLFDSLLDINDPKSFWHEELRDGFKEIIAKILSRKFTVIYCPNPKVRESCMDAVIHFLVESFSATIEEETAEETILRVFELKLKVLKKRRGFSLGQIMEKKSRTKIAIFVQTPPLKLYEKEAITIRTIESRYVLQWLQTLAKNVLGEKIGTKFDLLGEKNLKKMETLAGAIHKTSGGELENCFQSVKDVFLLWHRCMKINGLERCLNCRRTCLSPVFWRTVLRTEDLNIIESVFSSDTSLLWFLRFLHKAKRERVLKKATSFSMAFCEYLYKQMKKENSNVINERKPLILFSAATEINVNKTIERNLEAIASELGFCLELTFAELVLMGQDMGILTNITDTEENLLLVPFTSEVPEELSQYIDILGMCKATRKISENLSPDVLFSFLTQLYGSQNFEWLKDILQGPRKGESLIILIHNQISGLLEKIGIQVPREVRQLSILINSIKEYGKGIHERIREQILSLQKSSFEYLLAQHPFMIVILEKYAAAYSSVTQPFRSIFTDFLHKKFLETEDIPQRIMLSRFLEIPIGIIRKATDTSSLQMKGFVSAMLEGYREEGVQLDPLIDHLIATAFLGSMGSSEDVWKNCEFQRSLHNSRYIGLQRFGVEILAEMERQGQNEAPRILDVTKNLQHFLDEFEALKGDGIFDESYIEKLGVENILAKADYFMLRVYPKILELKTDILPSSCILDVLEAIISGDVLSTLPDTIRSKICEIREKVDLERLDGIIFLILDNASWIKVQHIINNVLDPDILLPVATTIPTTTAPGHLSIFLGVTPWTHRIYGNKVRARFYQNFRIQDLKYDWFRELIGTRSIHKVWKDILSKKGFQYKVVTKHRFDSKKGLTCILCANQSNYFRNTEPQLLFPSIKAVLNEKKTLIIALYSPTDIDIYSKKLKDVEPEEMERAISKEYEYHIRSICREIRDLLKKFRLLVILTSDHGFVEGEVETLKLDDSIAPDFRARTEIIDRARIGIIENQRGDFVGSFFPEQGRAINILEKRSGVARLVSNKLKSEKRIWVIDESNAKSYGLPVPNDNRYFLEVPHLFLFARRNTSFGFHKKFRREHKGISLDELLVPLAIKLGDNS